MIPSGLVLGVTGPAVIKGVDGCFFSQHCSAHSELLRAESGRGGVGEWGRMKEAEVEGEGKRAVYFAAPLMFPL